MANLDILEDPSQMKPYILQHMSANEIKEIVSVERTDISPAMFAMLQNVQPTTATVELALTLVNNVFTDDRASQPHSVSAYMQFLHTFPSLTLRTFYS